MRLGSFVRAPLAAALLVTVGGARAEAGEAPNSISVMGAYTFGDEDRSNIDDAYGASLILGLPWRGRLGVELHAFGDIFETNRDGFTDFYRPGLGLDLVYGIDGRDALSPFALVGAGGVYNDVAPDRLDEFGWFANAGLGLLTASLGDSGVRGRAEVRAVYDPYEVETLDVRVAAGIQIPLPGRARDAALPPPAEEKVRVVEVSTGLHDSDGDGIVDGADQCPATPPDTRVDGQGCTLPEVMQLEDVTFEFDEARLTANAQTVLDALVLPLLQRYPDMIVEVAGHTDDRGSDAYNQRLSQRRAQAVVEHLLGRGIDGNRMSAAGYGEREPLGPNDSDAQRERNRRVELRIRN